MARFRVATHLDWRGAPALSADDDAPTGDVSPPGQTVERLHAEVRALGPVSLPARAYDSVFGRFERHGRAFLAIRFLLVLATILLLLGGAQGSAVLDTKKGDYQPVTNGATINLYLAPHTASRYPVEVLPAQTSASALFGYDQGHVRVPDDAESQYGLRLRIVRYDPHIAPVLLISTPGEGYQRLQPASDDGVTVRYHDIPIHESGVYALLLTSTKDIGHVDLHVMLSKAPLVPVEDLQPDWIPLLGGIGLGTLLVGAYTPGAAMLREMRRLRTP